MRFATLFCTLLIFCLASLSAKAQTPSLQATFFPTGDNPGVSKLVYNGTILYDMTSNPNVGAPGYINDPNPISRNWDLPSQTMTWSYDWGTVTCKYSVPTGANRLNLEIKVNNNSSSEKPGINFFPLRIKFPNVPHGYESQNFHVNFNTDAPGVNSADFGSGILTIVNEDVVKPLGVGLLKIDQDQLYYVYVGSTDYAYRYLSWPHIDRRIPANSVDTYNVSLRFSPPNSDSYAVAGDIYSAYAAANPSTLNWSDRRPIGAIFLATPPSNQPRSSNDPNPRGWDVHDEGMPYIGTNNPRPPIKTTNSDGTQDIGGIQDLKIRMLELADRSITVLKANGAQGAITWDIEGQQFPQPHDQTNPLNPISYVGSPDNAFNLAPEMAGIAADYFAKFTAANLRVGICIRPQQLTNGDGSIPFSTPNNPIFNPFQQNVADIANQLRKKISYAKTNWNCTLFYIDSNDTSNFADLAAIKLVAGEFPDVLLIPEHSIFKDYLYSAPYSDLSAPNISAFPGTPPEVRRTYPNAFSAINIDGHTDVLDALRSQAVTAIRGGDVLIFNCWYDSPEAQRVKSIYADANPTVNHAPVAGNTNVDTYVGTSVVKGLLGSDPDGDPLTFLIVNNAMYGSSQIKQDTDGYFKLFYTSLNRLYGNDRVTYVAVDSKGAQSNVATVNINFINRPPVAQSNSIGVASGAPVSQYLFGTDPDNDALTFRLVNNPLHGTGQIKLDPQGKWRVYYQSVPNYVGSDSITFIAIDAKGAESRPAATISINVVKTSSQASSIESNKTGSGASS